MWCIIETGGHCKFALKFTELAAVQLEMELLSLGISENIVPFSL